MIKLFYKKIKVDKDYDFYKYKFYHECPICGKENSVLLDEDVASRLIDAEDSDELIQNIIPEQKPEIREFFITGMCMKCQKEIFSEPLEEES